MNIEPALRATIIYVMLASVAVAVALTLLFDNEYWMRRRMDDQDKQIADLQHQLSAMELQMITTGDPEK